MGKPPTTDQELTARVTALEERADATDAVIANLDARVTALEAGTPPDIEVPPDPGDPPVTTGRAVTITLDGKAHVFAQDGATDLGDFVGEHVSQHCYAASCATLPSFTVMFRPDVDGSREEVVFEWGHLWPSQPAANLGAYTAVIAKDGAELATVHVPTHNWFGRWRWQSAPRPIIATVADLIARKLVPRFDPAAGGGCNPPSYPVHYDAPMSLAGIEPGMPMTGDRADIGLVTEWQGDYLCTQSPAALTSLLAQLEGSGSLPWHYRDENTGAPLDTFAYPKATNYDTNPENDPCIPWKVGGLAIELDPAHEPSLAYVPFLLTGDPYALEELQFAVTYNVIAQPFQYRTSYDMTYMLRGHAWSLRACAHATKATPDVVPKWLLPKAYFRRILDGNRDWVAQTYRNNPNNPYRSLSIMEEGLNGAPEGTIPVNCATVPWQEDYESWVMGQIVELGFDDWLPNYSWQVGNLIARTDGKSGWNRVRPVLYRLAVRLTETSPNATDWADAWSINTTLGNCSDDAGDGTHMPPGQDMVQVGNALGALAIAARHGIAGAVDAHAWLQAEVLSQVNANVYISPKWSVV